MTTNTAGGTNNVAVGNYSLDALTSGDNNVCAGNNAGTSINSGSNNTCIGTSAGHPITTGNQNTCIGESAGNQLTSGDANVFIGRAAGATESTTDNQLFIARSNTGVSNAATWIYGNASGACYQGNNATAWTQTSDERIKKNIVNSPKGLTEINALQVRNFNFRTQDEVTVEGLNTSDAPGLQTGVIAQEIESVLPESVTENRHGQKEVTTDPILWAMVKSIQELSAKNDSLETSNTALIARIEALENA
jgi:hypothetical protein